MNEVIRLFKKTKTVMNSRGVSGFFDALKSYLYKNLTFLSVGVEKSGDVLIIGDFDFAELKGKGFVCKQITPNKFDEKYIALYDIFCFGDEAIPEQVRNDINKYNKLIISKKILGDENILQYIQNNKRKKIVYVSSSTNISGGVMVIAEQLQQLQYLGFNVAFISQDINIDMSWKKDFDVPILHTGEINLNMKGIDIAVATFWDTVSFVGDLNVSKKYYLVQNKEHLFYDENNPFYSRAKNTYAVDEFEFLTVSKWCQKWLKDEFGRDAKYIPNCIDTELFNIGGDCFKCDEGDGDARKDGFFEDKIRILIEGNPESEYKNVDEAFEIINKLDKDRFEVWFISYGGGSKEWYRFDKFFQKVPYFEMPNIYRSCDILLKTSKLESFSYPPLEMMACGGVCVVAKNEGNSEYVKDGYNALTYKVGNIEKALENIRKIVSDGKLRNKLRVGGFDTVNKRGLSVLKEELFKLFSG